MSVYVSVYVGRVCVCCIRYEWMKHVHAIYIYNRHTYIYNRNVLWGVLVMVGVGVYFERILKGSTASLWLRNLQMGITTIPLALGGVFFSGVRVCLCVGMGVGHEYVCFPTGENSPL